MAGGVRRIKLGSQGLEVSAQGLGCMGMSAFYGAPKPDADMISLIHHAIDSGVTFLDTSDIYGPFTNEILLGKALKGGVREKVELATKFGIYFADKKIEVRGDPAYVRAAAEDSLKRLGVDSVDLYYQHRIDTTVPIEVTHLPRFQPENVKHNKTLFEQVSDLAARKGCTPSQLALAWVHHQGNDVCPIPGTTKIENFNQNIGALSVKLTPEELSELESFASADAVKGDRYQNDLHPRFQSENVEHNKTLFERVSDLAARKGCTPSQLALAWVHHQGNDVCPIPGTTKIENFNQNIGALSVKLTPEELAELESFASADAVKGDRYQNDVSTWKNSETPPVSSWKAT
ncbi:hypothetical protein ACE6H2_001766 [Prunus campanulata]